MHYDLSKKLVEALGTCFLLMTVVGSGIMAADLAGDNVALTLLANTLPTGAILAVLIIWLGPVSGAHFNPAVTIAFTLRGEISNTEALAYMAVQFAAGIMGVVIAHGMFELPVVEMSSTVRDGASQFLSEVIATFGLVAVILGTVRTRPDAVGYAVGLYITAAYWFTASTSFANPAVTLARSLTDTFTGIRPLDAPLFMAAQVIGAISATLLLTWLMKTKAVTT